MSRYLFVIFLEIQIELHFNLPGCQLELNMSSIAINLTPTSFTLSQRVYNVNSCPILRNNYKCQLFKINTGLICKTLEQICLIKAIESYRCLIFFGSFPFAERFCMFRTPAFYHSYHELIELVWGFRTLGNKHLRWNFSSVTSFLKRRNAQWIRQWILTSR